MVRPVTAAKKFAFLIDLNKLSPALSLWAGDKLKDHWSLDEVKQAIMAAAEACRLPPASPSE